MNKQIFFAPLGLLYPIGKTIQWFIIGPNWLRWYLSDFGFIFFFVWLFCEFEPRNARFAILLSFTIASFVEMFQFSIGRGDIIDLSIFFFTAIVAHKITQFLPSKQ